MKDNRKMIIDFSHRLSCVSFPCYFASIPTRSKDRRFKLSKRAKRNLYSFSRDTYERKEGDIRISEYIVVSCGKKALFFFKISLVIHVLPTLKISQTILIMKKNSIITLLPKIDC